ncbi:glycosyltransferase [Neobacillus drentensis]|uniref:glycosyltransferase n=1 Tax=Neobacillus drentensis TaxID=220684 RepID=UPI002FFFB7CD
MQYSPLVSIVIPVFNGSNYIRESINSALNQTYKNIEIIVVNDGSTDNGATESVIKEEFIDKVRYYCKPNGGVSSALNFATKIMNGEWFSWLSHDDLYLPNKIELQINCLNNLISSKSDFDISKAVLFGFSEFIDENGKYLMRLNERQNLNTDSLNLILKNMKKNRLHGCTFLLPVKCFKNVGLFNEKLRAVQDYEYWYRLLLLDYKFYCIPEIIVQGRMHRMQVTHNLTDRMKEEGSELGIWICDKLYSIQRYKKFSVFYKLGNYAREKGDMVTSNYAFKHAKLLNTRLFNLMYFPSIVQSDIKGKAKSALKNIYIKYKIKVNS